MGWGGRVLPFLLLPVEICQFGCTSRSFPPYQVGWKWDFQFSRRWFKNIIWEMVFICVPSQSSPPVICWLLCVHTGHEPARMCFELWKLVSLLQLDGFGVCEFRRTWRGFKYSVLDNLHTSYSCLVYHHSHTDIPFESTGVGCEQRMPLYSKEIVVL